MWNYRCSKFIIFILIVATFYLYVNYNKHKPRASAPREIKRSCETGYACNIYPTVATAFKSTKPPSVKNAKRSDLENIHILPNDDNHNYLPEIVYDNKKITGKKGQKKLLILSYFDWESPQIGNILSQHPDIFYYNDPLFPFDSTSMRDGEEPISRRLVAEVTEYLEDLFDCKILESKMGYSDQILKKIAKKAYSLCAIPNGNVSECVQEVCKSSGIITAKTIRLYLQDVKGFLSRNKGASKIIILQRDPRVNLNLRNRRVKPGWMAGSDMFFQGRSLCSRMLHDLQEAKRLEGGGFKDFYRIVLFEHFLKSPETVLKGLFSFLGVSCETQDIKRMLKQSNAYKEIKRVTINKWNWIPEDEAGMYVDKACSFFYKNSMYNPMKRSHGFLQRYNLCKYCD